MAEVARKITQIGPSEQVSEPKPDDKPWLRQKNEPALWFMRFNRYLDMGHKRSLRAVVASEPQDAKATKGNKAPTKKAGGVTLSVLSVPGAWSRAAKVWNWKARAEAYDLQLQSKYAQFLRKNAHERPYSSRAYRVITLNTLAMKLEAQLSGTMPYDAYLAIVNRLQSVMRDIAKEMENFDDVTQDACDAGAARYIQREDIEKKYNEKLKKASIHERNKIALEKAEALDKLK